jgi:hypothetical protein
MLWWFIGVWLASGAVFPVLWLLGMVYRRGFLRDIEAEHGQVIAESHSRTTAASTAQSAYGVRRLGSSLAMWAFRLSEHGPGGTRIAPKVSRLGRYALSGLVSIGVLILLDVGSFSDSIITMRDLPPSSAVAQAPVMQAATPEARPMQSPVSAHLSPSPAELSAKPAQADTDGEEGMVGRGLPREAPSLGEAEQVALIQLQTGDAAESTGDDASRHAAAAPQMPAAGALLTAPVKPKVAERGSGHRRARGPLVVRPYATGSSRGTWLSAPNPNGGSNS